MEQQFLEEADGKK
jgi:hypothetical protein